MLVLQMAEYGSTFAYLNSCHGLALVMDLFMNAQEFSSARLVLSTDISSESDFKASKYFTALGQLQRTATTSLGSFALNIPPPSRFVQSLNTSLDFGHESKYWRSSSATQILMECTMPDLASRSHQSNAIPDLYSPQTYAKSRSSNGHAASSSGQAVQSKAAGPNFFPVEFYSDAEADFLILRMARSLGDRQGERKTKVYFSSGNRPYHICYVPESALIVSPRGVLLLSRTAECK